MTQDSSEGFVPSFAIRVGLVYPENLTELSNKIEDTVAKILRDIIDCGTGLLETDTGTLLYAEDKSRHLRFLSTLASDAEAILANDVLAAKKHKFKIRPFAVEPRPDGAADDEATRREQAAAYRFIVHNCDILIAIWDDVSLPNECISAEAVALAIRYGIPVVTIDPKAENLAVIPDPGPAKRRYLAPPDGAIDAPRKRYDHQDCQKIMHPLLLATLLPTVIVGQDSGAETEALNQRLNDWQKSWCGVGPESIGRDFGRIFSAIREFWLLIYLAILGLRRLLNDEPSKPKDTPPDADDVKELGALKPLEMAFQRADERAQYFAAVHRSAYVSIYILGAFAVAGAALALHFPETAFVVKGTEFKGSEWKHKLICAVAEMVCLAIILLLFFLDGRFQWHARWLEHRALAELLRHARHLARIGRAYPLDRLHTAARNAPDASAWVLYVVAALQRACTPTDHRLSPSQLDAEAGNFARYILSDQFDYHRRSAAENKGVAKSMAVFSWSLFGLTCAAVALKLLVLFECIDWQPKGISDPGLWAAIFPAFAMASYAIRAHGEFEVLARRSQELKEQLSEMRDTLAWLRDKDPTDRHTEPLTNDDLGRLMFDAAELMIHEAADWVAIFSVKHVEPG